MTMVRTMAQTQDLRTSVTQVLDVQKNPKKAFCVWFTSEAMAIMDHQYWWGTFKQQTIQLLQQFKYYLPIGTSPAL